MVTAFAETFRFVVHRARTDGVHVAPVSFFLRMLQRIAVAFRSRRRQVLRALLARHIQSARLAHEWLAFRGGTPASSRKVSGVAAGRPTL